MIPAASHASAATAGQVDQRVHLHGISWAAYETLLAARGDQGGVRITYLDGELELMTPSVNHEALETQLARLLETYAETVGIELEGFGSWTVRSERAGRGVEADECYVIGPLTAPPPIPDIAIEVVWTGGGIDKLEAYRGLGIPEVWVWQDGTLRVFLLEGQAYVPSTRSRLLSDLDPGLIMRCMAEPSQTQAVRALRAALASPQGRSTA